MIGIGKQELAATKQLGEFGFAGDDHVVPFEVAPLDIRGRTVQLGPILDALLARHDYPEPVARLVAEACVVTVLLGTSLKFQGKFILQTRTDGPIDMLVADFSTPDSLRAYARFDPSRLAEMADADAATLLGKGVLALTIDQGEYTQRYQGIVELDGISLEEAARRYFRQSEQIPTDLRLAVARQRLAGESREHWRAGGLLAQFLPQSPERMRVPDIHGGDGDQREVEGGEPVDDAWVEATSLVATVEPSELTDPSVGPERLLHRLFHEHGVRVFDSVAVTDKCSCARDKIFGVLQGFTAQEIADSVEDGRIRVECEFCSTGYEFDPAEFTRQ